MGQHRDGRKPKGFGYDPLLDQHLSHYFASDEKRRHLQKAGLIDSRGRLLAHSMPDISRDEGGGKRARSAPKLRKGQVQRRRRQSLTEVWDSRGSASSLRQSRDLSRSNSANSVPIGGTRQHDFQTTTDSDDIFNASYNSNGTTLTFGGRLGTPRISLYDEDGDMMDDLRLQSQAKKRGESLRAKSAIHRRQRTLDDIDHHSEQPSRPRTAPKERTQPPTPPRPTLNRSMRSTHRMQSMSAGGGGYNRSTGRRAHSAATGSGRDQQSLMRKTRSAGARYTPQPQPIPLRSKRQFQESGMTLRYVGHPHRNNHPDELFNTRTRSATRKPVFTFVQNRPGASTLKLFEGQLGIDEIFSIFSVRPSDAPLGIIIYKDGMIFEKLSTCCEFKYRVGARLGGPTGQFKLVCVTKGQPCIECGGDQTEAIGSSESLDELAIELLGAPSSIASDEDVAEDYDMEDDEVLDFRRRSLMHELSKGNHRPRRSAVSSAAIQRRYSQEKANLQALSREQSRHVIHEDIETLRDRLEKKEHEAQNSFRDGSKRGRNKAFIMSRSSEAMLLQDPRSRFTDDDIRAIEKRQNNISSLRAMVQQELDNISPASTPSMLSPASSWRSLTDEHDFVELSQEGHIQETEELAERTSTETGRPTTTPVETTSPLSRMEEEISLFEKDNAQTERQSAQQQEPQDLEELPAEVLRGDSGSASAIEEQPQGLIPEEEDENDNNGKAQQTNNNTSTKSNGRKRRNFTRRRKNKQKVEVHGDTTDEGEGPTLTARPQRHSKDKGKTAHDDENVIDDARLVIEALENNKNSDLDHHQPNNPIVAEPEQLLDHDVPTSESDGDETLTEMNPAPPLEQDDSLTALQQKIQAEVARLQLEDTIDKAVKGDGFRGGGNSLTLEEEDAIRDMYGDRALQEGELTFSDTYSESYSQDDTSSPPPLVTRSPNGNNNNTAYEGDQRYSETVSEDDSSGPPPLLARSAQMLVTESEDSDSGPPDLLTRNPMSSSSGYGSRHGLALDAIEESQEEDYHDDGGMSSSYNNNNNNSANTEPETSDRESVQANDLEDDEDTDGPPPLMPRQ